MSLADSAIETLQQATELNYEDPLRDGSLLRFANYGQVVMTGDLHGNRRNFEKLVRYCRLESTPVRHVLLHEMIHSDPQTVDWVDRSVELLLDAAQWKVFLPEQVHFLQSNHELAQLQKHEITKAGRLVTEEFERGVAEVLGDKRVDEALEAINAFIASFPVAARSDNGIFYAHSLPDSYQLDRFDPNCVFAPPDRLDLSEGGMIYQLVWGRRHTPELLEKLGEAWDVRLFIIGHQPQEMGYSVQHDRLVILATNNPHGVFLPVDCSRQYDLESLIQRIIPCAGVP
ncbi:MAG TPA: hypothetical protein PLT93_15920 [Phycisphaerae bacterium]|nr:hypothetical protein [Phycisphaerae bacterium]